MKKLLLILLTSFFLLNSLSCKPAKTQPSKTQTESQESGSKEYLFNSDNIIKDTASVPFGNCTVFELTKAMGCGWNLGNTLDATGTSALNSEISWGQPATTKEMIDGLARSGIKTIRIPVSWHNHIKDKETYTIDPSWMIRVKRIVDWAIEDDMYVIINSHHDNYLNKGKMLRTEGYYPSSENLEESLRFLKNIWGQIAAAFNNGYDEHLIFETMNEPRPAGTECEWWFSGDSRCLDAAKCLLQMNQAALDVIRASGGNNSKRFVMCPALQASENSASSSAFKMPQDIEEGRLILSIHAYTPYSFAMEVPGERNFTQAHKDELNTMFAKLKRKFIDNGYAVVIGEYGATNKENLSERVAWFDFYVSTAKSYGIPCILWDNGVWWINKDENGNADYNEGYGYYNRTEQKWYFPEILEVIVK